MHEPEKSTVLPRHFSFIISHGEERGAVSFNPFYDNGNKSFSERNLAGKKISKASQFSHCAFDNSQKSAEDG